MNIFRALLAVVLMASYSVSYALDLSGRIGTEFRYFFEDSETQSSLLAEPELYWQNETGSSSFTFKLFARYDELDDERTHIDIREANWLYVGEAWEFRAGIGKVFWGVTESNHLVDVINQSDLVESVDGEQKLGQPILQFTAIKDWGVIDIFALPGFRERTFPGEEGRLAGPIVVDTDNANYESSQEDRHTDFALRYSHSISVFDFGLSAFHGTNREPKFLTDSFDQAFYDQMSQFSIDLQATLSDWLWKLETIYRKDSIETFFAATFGFEYTLVNLADTGLDFGVLSEYNYDDRSFLSPALDNDLFVGARLTFNDVQSTELLLGFAQDLELSGSSFAFIEGSRRIGDSWKLTLDARIFSSDVGTDPVFLLKDDDYSSLTLEWYF